MHVRDRAPISASAPVQRRPWADRTLAEALVPSLIGPLALVQPLFVLIAAGSRLDSSVALPAGIHGAVLVCCLLTLRAGVTPAIPLALMYAGLLVDFSVVQDALQPLTLLSLGIAPLAVMLPVLLYEGVTAVVTSLALGVGLAAQAGLGRGWTSLADGLLVTSFCVIVAAVALASVLRRSAREVDVQEEAAVRESARAVAARARRAATSEHVRVLHDTVVNTLGALGRESVTHLSAEMIRARCRRDVSRVHELHDGRDRRLTLSRLPELDFAGLLPVSWSGLSALELRGLDPLADSATVEAIRDCVTEAVVNATKHSGADRVTVRVDLVDAVLRFEVSDDGRGFDGAAVAGGGLAESVFARGRSAGLDVSLRTAPGAGTTLRLELDTMRRTPTGLAPARTSPDHSIQRLLHRACLAWIAVVLAAEVLIEAVRPAGGPQPLHAVLAVSGALSLAAYAYGSRGRVLPRGYVLLLLGSVPCVTVASFALIDFGSRDAHAFQSLGLVPPLVALLVWTRDRRAFLVGVGLLLATVLGVLIVAHRAVPHHAVTALVVMVPAFCLAAAWWIFHHQFAAYGTRLAAAWNSISDDLLTQTAYRLADEVRVRWNAVIVQDSIDLLRDLADGTLSVQDSSVRRRCREEEQHLRQILSLSSDAVRMSWWLARALMEARARSIALQVNAGGIDARHDLEAEALGGVLVDAVARYPVGESLTVSLLAHRGAPHLLLVGGCDFTPAETGRRPEPALLDVRRARFGDTRLIEARWKDDLSS